MEWGWIGIVGRLPDMLKYKQRFRRKNVNELKVFIF